MFKKSSIIVLAIVMFVSFNSVVFAGNNKSSCNSGVNPAGKSDKPGFDKGNAWWKNQKHNRVRQSRKMLQEKIEILEQQLAAAKSEIEFLQEDVEYLESELDNQSCPEAAPMMQAMAAPKEAIEMEAVKFNLQNMSSSHPNSPDANEVYVLLRTYDYNLEQLIFNSSSGSYEISINIVNPDGEEINVVSYLEASEQDYSERDHFVKVAP